MGQEFYLYPRRSRSSVRISLKSAGGANIALTVAKSQAETKQKLNGFWVTGTSPMRGTHSRRPGPPNLLLIRGVGDERQNGASMFEDGKSREVRVSMGV
jgi:hypothetical protein